MAFEAASLAISIITTVIGIIGGSFAIMTYLRNQMLQRQEIVLPLMKEFDTDERLDAALKLLDDFVIKITGSITGDRDFDKASLMNVLRDHHLMKVNDPAEMKVRESFTALLDFFGKLGYLMDIRVITRRELGYFDYYIYKAKDNDNVNHFAKIYSHELYAVLLDKMHEIPEMLRGLSIQYYNRKKSKPQS